MEWVLDKKRPICPQLCESLCIYIASGGCRAGERLMSVREVALEAGVSPNTVQKSFEILEQRGVIYSKRGSGWYICEDNHIAENVRHELIRVKSSDYVNDMRSLGLDNEEIIESVKEVLPDE